GRCRGFRAGLVALRGDDLAGNRHARARLRGDQGDPRLGRALRLQHARPEWGDRPASGGEEPAPRQPQFQPWLSAGAGPRPRARRTRRPWRLPHDRLLGLRLRAHPGEPPLSRAQRHLGMRRLFDSRRALCKATAAKQAGKAQAMDKFTKLTGVAAPLPIVNVDTDMIIPKDYLKTIKRTGLSVGLFAEMRFNEDGSENPDFVLNKPAYRK